MDYGNAVYIGLLSTNISIIPSKLQATFNAAAHLLVNIPKFAHISSFITDFLHWLPICQHIQFKVCSLIRNCLAGCALDYLKAYCVQVSSLPSCSLLWSRDTWLSL